MPAIQHFINGESAPAGNGASSEHRDALDGSVATLAPGLDRAGSHRHCRSCCASIFGLLGQRPGWTSRVLAKGAQTLEARATAFIATMVLETGGLRSLGRFRRPSARRILQEAAVLTTQMDGEVIPSDVPSSLSDVRLAVGVDAQHMAFSGVKSRDKSKGSGIGGRAGVGAFTNLRRDHGANNHPAHPL